MTPICDRNTTEEAIDAAFSELESVFGKRATRAEVQREHHSHGESHHAPALPDIVCFPRTTEEVSASMKVSTRHQLPVVPFGAGTSVEGQVNAIRGGICIDLREMNKVVRLSVEDCDVSVEAGITRMQLVNALRNTGLTFFIDPGADATIGGMTGTRASGTTAVKYGTMRENVLSLIVVTCAAIKYQASLRYAFWQIGSKRVLLTGAPSFRPWSRVPVICSERVAAVR